MTNSTTGHVSLTSGRAAIGATDPSVVALRLARDANDTAGTSGLLSLGTSSVQSWVLRNDTSARLHIDRQNPVGGAWEPFLSLDRTGYLGVNVGAPAYPLHVAGSSGRSIFKATRVDGLGSLSGTVANSDNVWLGFDADLEAPSWIARSTSSAWLAKTNGHFILYGSSGNTANSAIATSLRNILDVNLTNGRVGIGVVPDSPLHIEAANSASQVRITTPGFSNSLSFLNFGPSLSVAFDTDWGGGVWTSRSTTSGVIAKAAGRLQVLGSAQVAGQASLLTEMFSVDLTTGGVGIAVAPAAGMRFQIGPNNDYNTLPVSLTGDVRLPAYGTFFGKNMAFLQARDASARAIGLQIRTQPGPGQIAEAVHVAPNGFVGILNTSPAVALQVTGDIVASGSITGGTVLGAIYQDIAEWVPATESMTPGTVVILNPEKNNEVMPSTGAYDTRVAGVVSAQPGVILGVAAATKAQIATTGRVRVRVDATKAPIAVGDLLVTSTTRGSAMKSIAVDIGGIALHRPGTILGKALEPLPAGEGEILVLLSLQ